MSHVTDVNTKIGFDTLDQLERALIPLGLELMRNQKTYKWYGRHVGDHPLPPGRTKEQLGTCEHAIRMRPKVGETEAERTKRERAYEIGIIPRQDGEGYTLEWDFWNQQFSGMSDRAGGEDCWKVVQSYNDVLVAGPIQDKLMQGYQMERTVLKNGDVQIKLKHYGNAASGDAFGTAAASADPFA